MTDEKRTASTGLSDRNYLGARGDKLPLEPLTGRITPGKRAIYRTAILNLVPGRVKAAGSKVSRFNQHATSISQEPEEALKLVTCRGLAPENSETVAHEKDDIETQMSRNIVELFVTSSTRNDGETIITQLLISLHKSNPRVGRHRSGKRTVPPNPAANIQKARFLSVAHATADKGLLFGPHVDVITARKIHAETVDKPHVEGHVAVGMPQLVKHCFGKSLHIAAGPARLTNTRSATSREGASSILNASTFKNIWKDKKKR